MNGRMGTNSLTHRVSADSAVSIGVAVTGLPLNDAVTVRRPS